MGLQESWYLAKALSYLWCFLWFLFSSDKERNNWPTGDEYYKAMQRRVCEAGTLLMALPTRTSFTAAFYFYPVCNWQVINSDRIRNIDFSEVNQYRKNAQCNFFWCSFSFNNKNGSFICGFSMTYCPSNVILKLVCLHLQNLLLYVTFKTWKMSEPRCESLCTCQLSLSAVPKETFTSLTGVVS